MIAISLWEPWGTAIALGLKSYETRSWIPRYRGPLAIHCSRTRRAAEFIFEAEVREYFEKVGITSVDQLNFGKVVAVVDLAAAIPVERFVPSRKERAFGDYSPGRFAWCLHEVRRLERPVLFRGGQRFFNIPDGLLK